VLTTFDIFALVLGLLAGLSLSLLHAWLSRRAVERLLAGGSRGHVLLGFPLRVLLPAIGLAALVSISIGSLLAGLLGFLLGQRVALRHMPTRTAG
jgi:hypothetical protein